MCGDGCTFEPTSLEQTVHTFLKVLVLMNHSQACDSFAAIHVQKLWQLHGVHFWSLNVLVIFWCLQPLGI